MHNHNIKFPCEHLPHITLFPSYNKKSTCLLISQSCTPYNCWQEHHDTSMHMEKLDNSLVLEIFLHRASALEAHLPPADFPTQLVTAAPKVAGHVTFS